MSYKSTDLLYTLSHLFLKYPLTSSPIFSSDIVQLPTDSAEEPGPALESEEIRPVPWSDWLESRVQEDKQTLEGISENEYEDVC
jgi:hypothetical protein